MQVSPYAQAITDAANKYGVDPDLAMRVVHQESSGNPNIQDSSAGAMGLMQLMPETAKSLGVDPRDPLQNIDGGVRYLKQQLDTYKDPQLALAAYNAGPGRVNKYLNNGVPLPAETTDYVHKISGSPLGVTPINQAFGADKMAAQQQPQTYGPQDNEGSLSSRLMAGGPGALFGAPNGVFPGANGQEGYNLGRGLQGAGAGLMAINNPAGGAAMLNAANMPLFRQRFSVSFDKRGFPMIFDTHRGTVVPMQPQTGSSAQAGGDQSAAPGAPGQSPEAALATDKALAKASQEEYQASETAYNSAVDNLARIKQAREFVNNPDTSQGPAGSMRTEAKAAVRAVTGIDMGGIDQGQGLNEIAKALTAAQAKAMGVTRYAGPEIKMAQGSTLSDDRTQAANLQSLDNLEQLAKKTIAQHAARVQYMKTHNGILGPGFQQYLDQTNSDNPTYQVNPAMSTPATAGGAARPPLSNFFPQ